MEAQEIEEWIEALKSDVIYSEMRMPSSALTVTVKSDYIPPGLAGAVKVRMEHTKNITEILSPFLPHQKSELQRLDQLQVFLSQIALAANRE